MKLANFIGIGIFLLIFLFVGIGVVPFEKLIGIDSFTIMFIVFMVLFAIYLIGLIVFVALNRRKRIIEVVEFSAPEGMTPADAGYVIDKTIDDRDISALLVYWAAKKYLEIDEKEDKNVLLKKLKDADDKMKDYEKILFNAIFSRGEEVNVKDLPKILQPSAVNISSLIKKENNKKYFSEKASSGATMFTLGITAVLVFLSYFFGTGGNFSVFCGVAIFIISTIFSSVSSKVYVQKRLKGIAAYVAGLILFLVCAALNMVFAANHFYVLLLLGMASLLCLITFILCPLIEYRNKEGRAVLGRLLGLKKYIELAEKDKMEKMVNENPELYYEVMPYAYVLNVSDEWIEQFNFVKKINSKERKNTAIAIGVLGAAFMLGAGGEILGGLLSHPRRSNLRGRLNRRRR